MGLMSWLQQEKEPEKKPISRGHLSVVPTPQPKSTQDEVLEFWQRICNENNEGKSLVSARDWEQWERAREQISQQIIRLVEAGDEEAPEFESLLRRFQNVKRISNKKLRQG